MKDFSKKISVKKFEKFLRKISKMKKKDFYKKISMKNFCEKFL